MSPPPFSAQRRLMLRHVMRAGLGLAGTALPFRAIWAQDAAARRTVTFYGDVTLSVPLHIERIAVAWEAANSIVTMLGYGDKIIATTRTAKRIPAFARIVPSIKDAVLASNGGVDDLNVERLLALKPDILFVPEHFPPLKEAELERGGIAVASLHDNSLAALLERTAIIGQLLGADAFARAREYQTYFAANQRRIAERLAKVPAGKRVTVYLANGAPLRTSVRPSLDQDWMDGAGAINVAEHWQLPHAHSAPSNTNVEAVLAANPEVIICLHASDVAAIQTNPQWAQIRAVKTGRVYANPRGLFWWCRETTEQALQSLWVATKLYPAAFADIDMAAETKRFYQQFYRTALSDADVDAFLHPAD